MSNDMGFVSTKETRELCERFLIDTIPRLHGQIKLTWKSCLSDLIKERREKGDYDNEQ